MWCDVNTISLDLIEYILISQSSDINSFCECTCVYIWNGACDAFSFNFKLAAQKRECAAL